ncbi:hypothetical protein DPMN_016285 [Dreissena polymorpha]|uniref:Uncharacterized protein n=1 Tax=Dreissena polymorpha TaxID=45954 RepID=A0A9D4N9F1_DREPO|nr:hypothetical protein DPMN_016285 [Dreissena polymorpha]
MITAVDDEIPEVYEQIKLRLKQLVTHGQDAQDVDDIPSATMQMLASLTGLMGELRLQDREHRRQIEEMKNRLKDKGKSIREIGLAVQERYEQIISGEFCWRFIANVVKFSILFVYLQINLNYS